ncbi:hypothetical protein KR200_001738 [Drosophila serrata]|nr:hypothetical protein KR200_001738 [Drosophila serrata]
MNLWLLSIQILLLLVPGIKQESSLKSRNNVPARCDFMLRNPQIYRKMCQGNYPLVAFTKYRDTLVKVGEPYTMYVSATLDTVLVVQKKSQLHECFNLEFKDSITFYCLDSYENNTVSLKQANMFCFPFHIQLPDDLMNECLIENKINDQYHKLDQIVGTKHAIVHYTYNDGGVQSSLRIPKYLHSPNPLLCLLLILLAECSRKF